MDYIDPLSQGSGAVQPQQQTFLTPQQQLAMRLLGPDIGMQESEVNHQRALAEALRKEPEHKYSTPLGGALGTIGAILKAVNAKKKEDAAARQAQNIMGQDYDQRGADLDYRLHAGQSADPSTGAAQQMALQAQQAQALRVPMRPPDEMGGDIGMQGY